MAEPTPRVFGVPFAKIYPMYVQKVVRKGRTAAELDAVIAWLTGYEGESLARALAEDVPLEAFFRDAPAPNPLADRVTGVVCGVRVEDVADPTMREIRRLDKLVDELAKGKALAKILDRPPPKARP